MTKKLLYVGLVLFVVAFVAMAADAITGKWVYEQTFGRGGGGGGNMPPRQVTLDLKADGAKLTGTMTMPGRPGGDPPPPAQITNGKVDGNNLSFDVTREFGGNSFTTKYKGVVNGNEMKLTSTMDNPQGGDPIVREVTAKKQ